MSETFAYGARTYSLRRTQLEAFLPAHMDEDPIEAGISCSRYLFKLVYVASSTTIVIYYMAMRMRFEVYSMFAFYAVFI